MKVEELMRNTDALTYLNALKATLTEIKEQFAEMEDQVSYMTSACDRTRKLIRKADNTYRLLVKCGQTGTAISASEISIDDSIESLTEIEELMENDD